MSRTTNSVIRRATVTADRVFVKLRFWDSDQQSTGAGVYQTGTVYSGNNPWDPDITIGTGQGSAQGYNFYAGQFYKMCCLGSAITVRVYNYANAINELAVLPNLVSAVPTFGPTAQMGSFPYVKQTTLGLSTGGHDVVTIKNYISVAKMYGVNKKMVLQDDNFQNGTTLGTRTNPANQFFWIVGSQNYDNAQINLRIFVKMTYYCAFYGRAQILS